MKKKQVISLFLSMVMFVTSIPVTAHATETTGTENTVISEEVQEEPSLEETLILEEELSEENAVPEESTENSTVFDLGNGKKTIVYHGQDVRFEEDGELVDYDPSLVKIDDKTSESGESISAYAFENKAGDSKQYIPTKLTDDSQILMEKDGYSIKMLPLDERIQEQKVSLKEEEIATAYEEVEEKKTIAVYESEDDTYSYEYTSLNQGIKESIVLNEKPESNIFQYQLELDGLTAELNEEENTILLNNEDETVAVIDRPFMNDATEEAYSEDLTYSLEEQEDGSYLVTLTVSKKYLNSVERIYPVTIDPTVTWKGDGSFYDVYVLNGDYADMNFYDPDTRVMPVGVGSKGTYRTYLKFPDLKSKLKDKYIDSAYLTLYETAKCSADQTVRLNRITESWAVASLTWNNRPTYYSTTYNNQFTTEGTQYASHKISLTAAARGFVNSTNNPNYGFVMRNINSDPDYAEFYGSRHTTTAYQPKFVITYYDKPTALSSMSVSRLTNDVYVKSNYAREGSSIYVSWEGINSHNLSQVQYKFVGVNGTAQPTNISSDGVDLSTYRSIGVATASGTNVKASYGASLPEGVYRLYLRGKDAGGMYGAARYKTVYVDGDAPSLTNVAVSPATSETSLTSNCEPKVSWKASDTYFSKVTISVDGKTAKTVSTSSGNGSYTIPKGTISTSGVHTIRVRAYDKSGKYVTKTLNYYVDVDVPEITDLTVDPATSDGNASGNRTPSVNWTIQADDLKQIEVYLNGTRKLQTTDTTVTSHQFAETDFTGSGKQVIKVKATDIGGNVAEKEISYYLDMDAPVFDKLAISPETSIIKPSGNKSPTINWEITDTALESVSYSMDGTTYTDMGTSKTGSYTLPSSVWSEESGNFTIYVKAKDKAGNESAASELNYYLGASSDYIPKELSSTEYYGKQYLTWELDAYDSEKVAYDIHRSEKASFTLSEDTLVEANVDITKNLYIDKEILEKDTYYYKIVVRDIEENGEPQNGVSEELAVTNEVTKDDFVNTLGQKEYLSYLDMGLPMGDISVEESSGNLLYRQSDFDISNAQLSYGFDRTYNSKNDKTSMLGTGWSDSYHKEIYTDGTEIYFVDFDGSSYRFTENEGTYSCEETKEYELTVAETGYEILTKDDLLYIFNSNGQLTEESEPNGCTISYIYDELGRLSHVISKEDTEGERKLSFTYNENSYLLHSVEDFVGTVYQYEYTEDNLTKVSIGEKDKIEEGVSYDYIYDSTGLLTKINDGMDHPYQIAYTENKVTELSYPDEESFSITYNEGNTKVEKFTPSDKKIHEELITFDESTGKLLSYKDAKGNVTSYEYVTNRPYLVARIKSPKAYQSIDENNQVVFHEEENVVETEYEYNTEDEITKETSADGSVTTYTYNENGDVTSEQTVKADTVIANTTYTYNEEGNLEETTDVITDTVETNTYDEDGNIESSIIKNDKAQISATTTTYDAQGNVIGESTTTGNVSSESETEYDAMGRTIYTKENGVETETTYDYLGRETQTTVKETGKDDIVETKSYNANGTLVLEQSSTGITKEYIYDNRNRILKTTIRGTDVETNVTEQSYGYSENVVIHSGADARTEAIAYKEATKNAEGTVISETYTDVLGRTVKEVSDTSYTDYTYDNAGNEVVTYAGNTSNDDCLVSMVLYNEEGNIFGKLTNPSVVEGNYTVGSESVVTYTEYDIKGNVSKETDALGNAIHYAYNDKEQLTSTDIAGDGIDIEVSYTDLEDGGRQIRIVDANGNVKEEHQNASGLTIQTSDLEGNAEETGGIITNYEYDSFGRVVKETYSDYTYITYTYEGESERIATTSEHLADGTVESSTDYTYNGQNNLIRIVHKDGENVVCEYNYTYDVKGHVLTESVSYGSEEAHVTSYEYDAEGRIVKVNHPASSALGTISYEYDDWGDLIAIKDDNAVLREYTYDGFGKVTAIKDYAKAGSDSYTLKSYVYDQLGRTTSMVYMEDGNDDSVLESCAYSYDKNSNILSERRISNLPEEGSKINETREYVYDSYGRLITSTITDHTTEDAEKITSYEYDAVGNRIKQIEDGVVTTYEYNGLNQLEKAETDTEEVLYSYDARGNQVLENNTTTGESVETTYNVAGQMVQLVKKSGDEIVQTQTNVYNQDGERISKEQDETTREYYYNQGVVSYTEDNNSLSTANIRNADGTIIGTYRGVTYYNYMNSIQESTSSIISETGDVAAVYSYSDFGETEEVVEDIIGNEICYTGAIYDKETGLYYMNARYYDAETGRFISQDSYRGEIKDEGTWNLYAYCANNPINYVDPSGHVKKTILSIYYNYKKNNSDLIKQANNSPYYDNNITKLIGVSTASKFKETWNDIKKDIKEVYIYTHGGPGELYFRDNSITYSQINNLKKKTFIKKIYLLSCFGAYGTNSVAKAFYLRTGKKAKVYASKESVSYRAEKGDKYSKTIYYPRYSQYYIRKNGIKYFYKSPIKKVY